MLSVHEMQPRITFVRMADGKDPAMKDILRQVAEKHGVTRKDIMAVDRSRRVSWPRQEAMWRMQRAAGKSLNQIGRFLQRDHTTVLHGIRAYRERMAADIASDLGIEESKVTDDMIDWPCDRKLEFAQ